MDTQKIITLDGFGVRADPREHFVKKMQQTFEVVWGLHGPRISILELRPWITEGVGAC